MKIREIGKDVTAPLKGVNDLLHTKHALRRGNLNVVVFYETDAMYACRLFLYYGNALVFEVEGTKTFCINPKWEERGSRAAGKIAKAFKHWYTLVGYEEVPWNNHDREKKVV
jgi:hypothetical protein